MSTDASDRKKPLPKDEYRRQWEAKPRPPVRQETGEPMKVPELLRSLQRMLETTGDPLFADTIAAVEAYGFKGRGLTRGGNDARKEAWGDPDEGYLNHIRFNKDRFGWTVPECTQEVVARLNAHGPSFDTIVDRLSNRYRAWAAAGHPAPTIADPGDIGQTWTVFPIGDEPLNLGDIVVPVDGVTVSVTNFWRRIFRDGVIRVQANKTV